MRLQEFTAVFTGDYTDEQRSAYSMIHGDEEKNWPDTDATALVTINLEAVTAFNEVDNEKHEAHTNVYLMQGNSYLIDTSYEQFKVIMHAISK